MEYSLPNSGATITIPRTFGNYVFRDIIGCGMSSVVVLAENQKSKELAACKILDRKDIELKGLLRNLEQELRIIQTHKHPGLCKLYDIIYLESSIIICMEYCSKCTLYDYVATNGPLPIWEIRKISKRILETIAFLHSKGIAHRDIKLENIVLTKDDEPKLVDFGICTACTYFSISDGECPNIRSTKCGTPYYMAPEVLTQNSYNPFAVDIWQFGISLYIMSTGHFPWCGTMKQVAKHIINGEIYLLPHTNSTVKKMIESALQLNPSKRAKANDLISLLDEASLFKVNKANSISTHPNKKFFIIKPNSSLLSSKAPFPIRTNRIQPLT